MTDNNPNTRISHLSRNGLQIIAALVRMEARNVKRSDSGAILHCPIEELADRLDTIILTHKQIDPDGSDVTVPLGACIAAVIGERNQAATRRDQIEMDLGMVILPLDKAVPMMLLFAEVLSVTEDGSQALKVLKILLTSDPSEKIVIVIEFDKEIEGFDEIRNSQLISLVARQFGVKLSHTERRIRIESDFTE